METKAFSQGHNYSIGIYTLECQEFIRLKKQVRRFCLMCVLNYWGSVWNNKAGKSSCGWKLQQEAGFDNEFFMSNQ